MGLIIYFIISLGNGIMYLIFLYFHNLCMISRFLIRLLYFPIVSLFSYDFLNHLQSLQTNLVKVLGISVMFVLLQYKYVKLVKVLGISVIFVLSQYNVVKLVKVFGISVTDEQQSNIVSLLVYCLVHIIHIFLERIFSFFQH